MRPGFVNPSQGVAQTGNGALRVGGQLSGLRVCHGSSRFVAQMRVCATGTSGCQQGQAHEGGATAALLERQGPQWADAGETTVVRSLVLREPTPRLPGSSECYYHF